METKIYSLFGNGKGMMRIDVPQNSAINSLPIGTVLQLNGYSNPRYVIVKNLGINERSASYGAMYETVDIEKKTFSRKEALGLKHISEKTCDMIQMYITNDRLPMDEVLMLHETATKNEQIEKENKAKTKSERDQLESIGRELFKRFIPEAAKALIVARLDIDESDSMTDYFNVSHGETVIIGYSSHTRDLFNEMRKYANLIPETAHLSEVKPESEHKEKYSMGRGYYLKASNCYSTGWTIRKETKYGQDWDKDLYVAMAKRCIFK